MEGDLRKKEKSPRRKKDGASPPDAAGAIIVRGVEDHKKE